MIKKHSSGRKPNRKLSRKRGKQRKKLENGDDEGVEEYKLAKQEGKRIVARAKSEAFQESL